MNAAAPAYVLDNDHEAATAHHGALAELLDPFTASRLAGLGDWGGAHCLEVGAGGGSIAHWLADRVDADGLVVATDLKPDLILPRPQLRVVAHDLTSDVPLRKVLGGPFDLIHVRATLGHLANRRLVLHWLADLLAPGGWLLVEDWAAQWDLPVDELVIAARDPEDADMYWRYQQAVGRVFSAAGVDPRWALRVNTAMAEEGLKDRDTRIHGEFWHGGSPGLRLAASTLRQLAPKLLGVGMTQRDLAALPQLFQDPQLLAHGRLMYSTAGRRHLT